MDKVIPFNKGIHRQPTLGEDGELSELVNLIPKNGELVNIRPLESMISLEDNLDEDAVLKAVHKVEGSVNYIMLKSFKSGGDIKSNLIYYRYKEGVLTRATIKQDIRVDNEFSVVVVGNVLFVTTDAGLRYAIWKGDHYVWLAGLPLIKTTPFLRTEVISHSMLEGKYSEVETEAIEFSDILSADKYKEVKGSEIPIVVTNKQKEDIKEDLFGMLNDAYAAFNKHNRFALPFLVRFAYRMYDGNHIAASVPFVMCPTSSGYPLMRINYIQSGSGVTLDPIYTMCDLSVNLAETAQLDSWKDIIMGLDVFVSTPLRGYTEDEDAITQIEAYNGEPFFVDYEVGETALKPVKDAFASLANGYSRTKIVFSGYSQGYNYFSGAKHAEKVYVAVDNESLTFKDENTRVTYLSYKKYDSSEWKDISVNEITDESLFRELGLDSNIYSVFLIKDDNIDLTSTALIANEAVGHGSAYRIEYSTENYAYQCDVVLDLQRSDKKTIKDQISDTASFYKIATIPFDELKDGVYDIEIEEHKLENLVALETLSAKDYTHRTIYANSAFAYNNRVNIIPSKFSFPFCNKLEEQGALIVGGYSNKKCDAYVLVENNGIKHYADVSNTEWLFDGLYFFCYPSIDAKKLYVLEKSGEVIDGVLEYPLERMNMMNMAFAFNDMKVIEPVRLSLAEINSLKSEIEASSDFIPSGNQICVTEANNPFLNVYTNAVQLSSEIVGVTTTTKALSQGQFGQFPLYAFCKDGIWAMEVAADGSYSSKQPVSRDVCNNPDSITQIDGAVVFTTDQGLMMIQGSEVVCLSDIMVGHNIKESDYFSSTMMGTHYDIIKDLVIEETRDFREILSNCKIAYDYVNRLLRIFPNEDTGKYYVFSLDTNEFSTAIIGAEGDVKNIVAGYPDSIVHIGNNLCVPSKVDGIKTVPKGLLLTRPITMDEPFALKKLQDIRLHYSNLDGLNQCKVMVYASNDKFNWYLLDSLRGKPYKYFRFAVYTQLRNANALTGMAIRYEVERTNKLR